MQDRYRHKRDRQIDYFQISETRPWKSANGSKITNYTFFITNTYSYSYTIIVSFHCLHRSPPTPYPTKQCYLASCYSHTTNAQKKQTSVHTRETKIVRVHLVRQAIDLTNTNGAGDISRFVYALQGLILCSLCGRHRSAFTEPYVVTPQCVKGFTYYEKSLRILYKNKRRINKKQRN